MPYNLNKSDVVLARNNVLIDDGITNLDNWHRKGGYVIYFDTHEKVDKDVYMPYKKLENYQIYINIFN